MKTTISTFGANLAAFYEQLDLHVELPSGIEAMNPYRNPETMRCVRQFCEKYFNDNTKRISIWGINPGRFGGGVTGLSFTDPVILRDVCGIETHLGTHKELSAEYVWGVVQKYQEESKVASKQGAEPFFQRFFLTALCPLGFTKAQGGSVVNYNFYDDKELHKAVLPFMVSTMQQQCALGLHSSVAICFGTGKLQQAFERINAEHHFFERILPLEHPRFIMQYRRKQLHSYEEKYLTTFQEALRIVGEK